MKPATDLGQGAVIGGEFKVTGELSRGGMGVIYLATHLTTGHQRAVKVMNATHMMDERARERFHQEATIGARIQSDHVVQVVAAGIEESSQTPWLAMELLQGRDLERHVNELGAMPWLDVHFVVGQVAHALTAAHDVDVVHRDIKPENIFLSASRVVGVPFMVKVLDFGIAKIRSSSRSATIAVGTPGFMAPEQTYPNDEIRPSTDIWSFALVVFRMLTGIEYWKASHQNLALPILWREMLVDPMPPASVRAAQLGVDDKLLPGFDAWFARCTERDPLDRYQHAREAYQALQKLFATAGVIADAGSHQSRDLLTSVATPLNPSPTPPASHLYAQQPHPTPVGPTHRVSFRESGERVVALTPHQSTLLETALAAGIPHYHACGGEARCSTCRVVVLAGKEFLSKRTEAEQQIAERRRWQDSTRLACQTRVLGPCVVRRLVMDDDGASVVDIRRNVQADETITKPCVVLALRLEGIEGDLDDGFPHDAIHVLERCLRPIQSLLGDNGGALLGLEATTIFAELPPGADGVRRALRVALRAVARIRRLNPYFLKHFGVQVTSACGLGAGQLVYGSAAAGERTSPVLLGTAIHQARQAVAAADIGEVIAASALIEDVEHLVTTTRDDGWVRVVDFTKADVILLVQTSFDALEERIDDFGEAFYNRLFELEPRAQTLFEHTDMARQRKMLVTTLTAVVRGLDDFAAIEQTVRELGERHVDYGVKPADYKLVGQALLSTLESFLGDAFTPEAEMAWREIYGTLTKTMIPA